MQVSTERLFVTEDSVQRLMTRKEILFEKLPLTRSSYQDISIITIFDNPLGVSTKRPVRITSVPRSAPLIITMPRPISYSSDKVVPWNYGDDVYDTVAITGIVVSLFS